MSEPSRGSHKFCQPRLHGILCSLRRCLIPALNSKDLNPYFHYAEAFVYADPKEWWPLCGKELNFDILNSQEWPSDYPDILQALSQPGINKISMLALLAEHKDKNTAFGPLLRPLSVARQKEIQRQEPPLLQQEQPREVSSVYIPGIDCYYGDASPTTQQVGNFDKYLAVIRKHSKYYPKPESGLLLLVPLTGQLIGSSVILAQIIIMLDIRDKKGEEWKNVVSQKVLPVIDDFSRAGSALLLDRYESILVGYSPTADSDALGAFVHPALTRRNYSEMLAFKDTGSHEALDGYKIGYHGEEPGEADGWPFLTAFLGTIRSFSSLVDSEYSDGPAPKLVLTAKKCADYTLPHINQSDFRAFKESLHRWLKTLYAEGGTGGTRSHYLLRKEHLQWIAATVSKVIKSDWPNGAPIENATTWPCSIIPSKNSQREFAKFAWPVVPGIFFLLPWLKLISELPGELKNFRDGLKELPNEFKPTYRAAIFEAEADRTAASPAWKARTHPVCHGDKKRCGLILHIENLPKSFAGSFQRSILRGLTSVNKHMGATIRLFHDVLTCDLTRVKDVPAAFALASQGILPPDIFLDFESLDTALTITFSWIPPAVKSEEPTSGNSQ